MLRVVGLVCALLPQAEASLRETTTATTTATSMLQAQEEPDMSETTEKPAVLPMFREDGAVSMTNADGQPVRLRTEFPKTYSKFMEGLMWREEMPDDAAMIFPWAQNRPSLSFWMVNTPLPLDIIFANEKGEVVSVKKLLSGDPHSVGSDAPANVAIEVKQGIAAKLGIGPGTILDPIQFPSSAFVCRDHSNCPEM